MGVHTIRNSTGDTLVLYDGIEQLASIPSGHSIHNIDVTITKVGFKGRLLSRKQGAFVNNQSYDATYDSDNDRVIFNGDNLVIFG